MSSSKPASSTSTASTTGGVIHDNNQSSSLFSSILNQSEKSSLSLAPAVHNQHSHDQHSASMATKNPFHHPSTTTTSSTIPQQHSRCNNDAGNRNLYDVTTDISDPNSAIRYQHNGTTIPPIMESSPSHAPERPGRDTSNNEVSHYNMPRVNNNNNNNNNNNSTTSTTAADNNGRVGTGIVTSRPGAFAYPQRLHFDEDNNGQKMGRGIPSRLSVPPDDSSLTNTLPPEPRDSHINGNIDEQKYMNGAIGPVGTDGCGVVFAFADGVVVSARAVVSSDSEGECGDGTSHHKKNRTSARQNLHGQRRQGLEDPEDDDDRVDRSPYHQMQMMESRLRAEFVQEAQQIAESTKRSILANAVQATRVEPEGGLTSNSGGMDPDARGSDSNSNDNNNNNANASNSSSSKGGKDSLSVSSLSSSSFPPKVRLIACMIGIICLLVGVGLTLGIAFGVRSSASSPKSTAPEQQQQKDTNEPTHAMTNAPAAEMTGQEEDDGTLPSDNDVLGRMRYMQSFLESISGLAVYDNTSDQYQAIRFLSEEPTIELPRLTIAESRSSNTSRNGNAASDDNVKFIETYVLVLFYVATKGSSGTWNDSNGFLSIPDDVCSWNVDGWRGVICDDNENEDEERRVVGLNLESQNLAGTLISELGHLYELEYLLLAFNHIGGTIPSEIGQISRLKQIQLQGNGMISGSIPQEVADITTLEFFAVGNNELTGPIPSFSNNDGTLFTVNLDNNKNLEGSLPNILSSLPASLHEFACSMCRLDGSPIPGHLLGNLPNLQVLTLDHTGIQGSIPTELGLASSLIRLKLSYNRLSGKVPTELGLLRQLVALEVAENDLHSDIPTELGQCSQIQRIELQHNRLHGSIPQSIANITTLQHLELWSNQLDGPIPNFTLSESLEVVNLDWNSGLRGNIGGILNSISPDLVGFYCARCILVGKLSKVDFTRFRNLEVLYMPESRLIRGIPESLGQATTLKELVLFENQLTGTIPPSVTLLPKLTVLDLSANTLTGSIPLFDPLGKLGTIDLSLNDLTGELTPIFDSLPHDNLEHFSVSYNDLTGSVPADIDMFGKLREFDVASNRITGTLPYQLSFSANLQSLDVSGNQMTGTVPISFASSFEQLEEFRIHVNSFTGSLNEIFCSNHSTDIDQLSADCHEDSREVILQNHYVGCYGDGEERDLPYRLDGDIGGVVECLEGCGQLGFKYAGLQFRSECFCGNDFGTYGRFDPDHNYCNTYCSNSPDEICGGRWFQSVYLAIPGVPRNETNELGYIGCYRDELERDLPHLLDNPVGSIQECRKACGASGYTFAGLQNSAECFCGDDGFGKHGKFEPSRDFCNSTCIDRPGDYCGGTFFNSIYFALPDKRQDDEFSGYFGCYKDEPERDLPYRIDSNISSVAACRERCGILGYDFAGLQYFSECFCGNDFGRYNKVEPEDDFCNAPCTNSPDEICGGGYGYYNSIYLADRPIDSDADSTTYVEYLGCYPDAEARTLPFLFDDNITSIAECRRGCDSLGYRFAGLQYYTECFCGDSLGSHGLRVEPDSDFCNTPCANAQRGGEICGGQWHNSIYVAKLDITPQVPEVECDCCSECWDDDLQALVPNPK